MIIRLGCVPELSFRISFNNRSKYHAWLRTREILDIVFYSRYRNLFHPLMFLFLDLWLMAGVSDGGENKIRET